MPVKQRETEDKIVDFLDLDTSKITFSKPKSNKYNGKQIGILYEGKTLYVKYEGYTPFGMKENLDKDGKFQNFSMQINCEDKYLEKAKELDQFFIDACFKNKWGLNKNLPIECSIGEDEYGVNGLWKRICKKPYKINNAKERVYLVYPSKMEFTPFYRGDKLATKIFTWDKKESNGELSIVPHSKVKFIAAWFSITTFGLTLKPKLMQILFKEEENIFDEFMLDSEEEEDEDVD